MAIICNIAIVVCMVIGLILQGIFIAVEHKEKYVPAVILKGSASLMFVIIGAIAYKVYMVADPGEAFPLRVFIGLIFGMFGDICLNLRYLSEKHGQKIFLLGILFFLIGHVLYLLALLPGAVKLGLCAAIGAALAAGLLFYIFKTMEVKTSFKIFGVVYLGAVIIMTAVAIGIWIGTGTVRSAVYALGALLFTASDIVLIFNTFSGVTRFSLRITNLSLYYIGQLLIAVSILFA